MSITNGSSPTRRSNGHQPRSPRGRSRESAGQSPFEAHSLEPFRDMTPVLAEVQMWPMQPGAWLVPVFRLALPVASGLRIESRSSARQPAFTPIRVSQCCGPEALRIVSDLNRVAATAAVPIADLQPAGWEPRAALKVPESL